MSLLPSWSRVHQVLGTMPRYLAVVEHVVPSGRHSVVGGELYLRHAADGTRELLLQASTKPGSPGLLLEESRASWAAGILQLKVGSLVSAMIASVLAGASAYKMHRLFRRGIGLDRGRVLVSRRRARHPSVLSSDGPRLVHLDEEQRRHLRRGGLAPMFRALSTTAQSWTALYSEAVPVCTRLRWAAQGTLTRGSPRYTEQL